MTTLRNRAPDRGQILLGLQFLSDFGDQITTALLATCLLDITQSEGKVGFIYFVTTLGAIVFTLAGGFFGDQLSKRNILVYCDIGRGFIVLLMIIALQERSIFLIYCTSFLLAILGSLNRPVKASIWAQSISEKKLERYNSLSEFSVQGTAIVGPLIASFFIVKNWIGLGFVLDAITFFICAVVFALIFARQTSPREPVEHDSSKNFIKGFSTIFSDRDIFKYVFYDAIQMIGFGAFNAMFVVLAQRNFGWTKAEYSYHLSIVAVFTTIGAFFGAMKYVAKIDHIIKLRTCALACALALAGALHLQSFPFCSLLIGLCDGLSVLTIAITKTRVQIIAKNYYPARLTSIIAARFIIIKIATLFGTGACLVVNTWLDLKIALAIFLLPIGLSILPLLAKQANIARALSRNT